jgi:hypothetical protein
MCFDLFGGQPGFSNSGIALTSVFNARERLAGR